MKKLSIGVRLTLWYLAIFSVAQFAFGAGMWFILRAHLYDLVDDGLESQGDDLKNFLAAHGKDASVADLHRFVTEAYAAEHSGEYLELSAENGELIYRSGFLQRQRLTSTLFHRGEDGENRWIDAHPFRFLVQQFQVNGHSYTALTGAQTDDVVDTLSLFRFYLFLFAPGLFLLAALGGYWLSRKALSPVDAIVSSAREISGSSLHRRLQKLETGDELQRLSDTINEMLARIETAFLRITEFTADASHELRTPVSLIRTEAELALRRPRGQAEYEESLRHILLEAERTSSLIEQLLALARADSGRETLQMQPVDLSQVLHAVTKSWQQLAAIRNVQFSSTIAEEAVVTGDAGILRRLADILLDNAFKYTPSAGSVHLSLEMKKEDAIITVQDSGIGIPEEDHHKIFERFYRIDKARGRAHGGAGLGLAIAQWIVAQHHGSIAVESHPGAGAQFRVEIPLFPVPTQHPSPA